MHESLPQPATISGPSKLTSSTVAVSSAVTASGSCPTPIGTGSQLGSVIGDPRARKVAPLYAAVASAATYASWV